MEILEYDQVDPLEVLNLNLLSLAYALTPERAALIRRLDRRPFPFFGVYAVEDGVVAGQVLIYRLTMTSTDGREDVGGMSAVCTHPAFSRRGIATRLFDEAHDRMRAAGLRFSTLGTARHRGAYAFYRRQGYEDVLSAGFTFAYSDTVQQVAPLRAERARAENLYLADGLFARVAAGRLGFAVRPRGFLAMLVATGELPANSVWLLWDGSELAGYAIARNSESVLPVDDLLAADDGYTASAIAAIIKETAATYVCLRINHPRMPASLRAAGYPPARPGWSTFMIKPLTPDVSVEEARALFGIGTERFLISALDVT
jgi:ribosomal protein S18 acetylase RimI-like enzyme